MQEHVHHDTVLVYHNSAFALLADCKAGTGHVLKGTGKRTHLIQLNALARQVVASNPRWHLVDIGQMSDAFLAGQHLRDEHHPNREFMMQVLNMYLNLHASLGRAPHAVSHTRGSVDAWDADYSAHAEQLQARYQREMAAVQRR